MTNPVFEHIQSEISDNPVVLYMKGTADMPQCGFSSVVVQILKAFNLPFKDVNVLDNQEIRQGIKEFSNWPTIPQVYIKGEFVGGCDILREMYQTGELKDLLIAKGVLVG